MQLKVNNCVPGYDFQTHVTDTLTALITDTLVPWNQSESALRWAFVKEYSRHIWLSGEQEHWFGSAMQGSWSKILHQDVFSEKLSQLMLWISCLLHTDYV